MKGIVRFDKEGNAHYFVKGYGLLNEEREVTEKEWQKLFPPPEPDEEPVETHGQMRPMHSESIAVPVSKIGVMREECKKHGVPTDFDKHGRPIFNTRDHQRRYCQAFGYRNNDENWSGKGSEKPNPTVQTAEEVMSMLWAYKG